MKKSACAGSFLIPAPDYIKTSTGFAGGGATFEDIALFLRHVRGIKIKAAGGIRSIEDAARSLSLARIVWEQVR